MTTPRDDHDNPFAAPAAPSLRDGDPFDGIPLPPDCRPESLELRKRGFAAERAVIEWGWVYVVLGALFTGVYGGIAVLGGLGGLATGDDEAALGGVVIGIMAAWFGFVTWVGRRLTRVDPDVRGLALAALTVGLCVGPLGLLGVVPLGVVGGARGRLVLDWRYDVARRETATLDAELLAAHRARMSGCRRLVNAGGIALALAALVGLIVVCGLGMLGAMMEDRLREVEEAVEAP